MTERFWRNWKYTCVLLACIGWFGISICIICQAITLSNQPDTELAPEPVQPAERASLPPGYSLWVSQHGEYTHRDSDGMMAPDRTRTVALARRAAWYQYDWEHRQPDNWRKVEEAK